jgi:hypothetical protein
MKKSRRGHRETKPFGSYIDSKSVKIALGNWEDWRLVFEYKSKPGGNPLLESRILFWGFCREYSVHRTIRRGTHNKFRQRLARDIQDVIRDKTGSALDRYEKKVRPSFGTRKGTRKMISVLSKVSAFVSPESFIAWDRYSRGGLNIALGRAKSRPFDNYSSYLADVDQVWKDEAKHLIKAEVRRCSISPSLRTNEAFLRRILDVSLMRCGGRKFR